ncbi:MAG: OmpH family outer membrane protein [Humidesulfovibrio sp.]|uniref:OmpH family outer membrane protein n=1 Tax=Humidesulfovibrio sp. TaxID=2910988 RepID=UPI002733C5A7|nr:OmpH family outer membrane protein [Humidesulfovibrio sp.]MDP2848510.1 OmpH family outer membrane protein [Humidesulfovibrio sp.]
MKKFCALLLLVAMASVLAGCNNNNNKFAVVDGAKVFRESKPGQEAMAYLRTKSTELQAEAKAAQEKVQAKQTQENAAAFQEAVTKYQTTMGTEQQRVVGLLQDQFNKVLEKYRKDNKVDVILAKDVVLSYDEASDITNKVIEEINKTTIDLNAKPEAKPEAPAVGAPAAPAASAAPAAAPAPAAPAAKPAEAKKP